MFIKQHNYAEDPNILLTFIKSLNVKVFPCGRRRSEVIDRDGDNETQDKFYIPFDPEARLNTELNNRTHAGTSGFAQSFVEGFNIEKSTFSFTINGYVFTINDVSSINTFAKELADSLGVEETSDRIYANIKLEEIPLYEASSKSLVYNTWILRNQSASNIASNELDLSASSEGNSKSAQDYYFSGLSFSFAPITGKTGTASDKFLSSPDNEKRRQHDFSLCILTKENNGERTEWKIFEPAKLPKIEHGEIENSVKLGHLNAESIQYKKHPVGVFDITEMQEKKDTYQLHLYNATTEVS